MSHIVEELLDESERDRDLLARNRKHGDHPELSRDLDFLLISTSKKTAQVVAEFVLENHYGTPTVSQEPGTKRWFILVVVPAPATEQAVCCISGLMTCVANIFGLEYNGWGCVLQGKPRQSRPAKSRPRAKKKAKKKKTSAGPRTARRPQTRRPSRARG